MKQHTLYLLCGLTTLAFVVACSNPTTPKDCIQAAEAAGAPQSVLDFLHNPTGGLTQAERLAIRQFLNRTALNDLCQKELDQLDVTSDAIHSADNSDATVLAEQSEGVPNSTVSEAVDSNGARSLTTFGGCVAHYAREIEYLPDELPFGDSVVGIANNFDSEAKQWMSIGLCLDYAPRLKVDDVSGKCLVSAMEWYSYEYPESNHLAQAVAGVACLPAFEK